MAQLGKYLRIQLPQLRGWEVESFKAKLQNLGISSFEDKIRIGSIKYLQSDIDRDKVKRLEDLPFWKLSGRVFIVTKDHELIDGHHTIEALKSFTYDYYLVKCLILDDSYENMAIKLGALNYIMKIKEEETKPKTDTDRLKDRQKAEIEALKKKHFNELQTSKQKEFNKKMNESKPLTEKILDIWTKYGF